MIISVDFKETSSQNVVKTLSEMRNFFHIWELRLGMARVHEVIGVGVFFHCLPWGNLAVSRLDHV
ncbi:MAG: hypothetical protein CSB13_05755 [Chloroflexi bacterium]|nr:MAG: hypothetical protein CSB13_05755 [Chloroflexota bacterium]